MHSDMFTVLSDKDAVITKTIIDMAKSLHL